MNISNNVLALLEECRTYIQFPKEDKKIELIRQINAMLSKDTDNIDEETTKDLELELISIFDRLGMMPVLSIMADAIASFNVSVLYLMTSTTLKEELLKVASPLRTIPVAVVLHDFVTIRKYSKVYILNNDDVLEEYLPQEGTKYIVTDLEPTSLIHKAYCNTKK